MDTLKSLQELSKRQMEILSKQPSFTLEQAKQQVEQLKKLCFFCASNERK